MLVLAAVCLSLALVGTLIVATAAHAAMRRLGLELDNVLVWLGVAELPLDALAVRRATPGQARRTRTA